MSKRKAAALITLTISIISLDASSGESLKDSIINKMATILNDISNQIEARVETPKSVFMAMNNEVCRTKDFRSMMYYVTEESKPIVENLVVPMGNLANLFSFGSELGLSCVGTKSKIQVLREIVDINVAEVTYNENGDIKPIRLMRENGKWKVDLKNTLSTYVSPLLFK